MVSGAGISAESESSAALRCRKSAGERVSSTASMYVILIKYLLYSAISLSIYVHWSVASSARRGRHKIRIFEARAGFTGSSSTFLCGLSSDAEQCLVRVDHRQKPFLRPEANEAMLAPCLVAVVLLRWLPTALARSCCGEPNCTESCPWDHVCSSGRDADCMDRLSGALACHDRGACRTYEDCSEAEAARRAGHVCASFPYYNGGFPIASFRFVRLPPPGAPSGSSCVAAGGRRAPRPTAVRPSAPTAASARTGRSRLRPTRTKRHEARRRAPR